MVVDIRYHLASLVAVFLSLGLGILIGTSLAGGEALGLNEEWLASLERELEQMQTRRNEASVRLLEVERERDLYARFAAEVSQVLLNDALADERAGIVLMGTQKSELESVQQLFRDAGATVTRIAHVKPTWNERMDHFLALLTPDAAGSEKSAGVLLAEAMIAPRSDIFTAIDSPSLWLRADSPHPPTFVAFVLTDPQTDYTVLLEQAFEELAKSDVTTVLVSPGADEGWQRLAEERGLPFIAHATSPLGRMSLVHLLAQKDGGIFGRGATTHTWPQEISEISGAIRP